MRSSDARGLSDFNLHDFGTFCGIQGGASFEMQEYRRQETVAFFELLKQDIDVVIPK
jgi:hypothetical protein